MREALENILDPAECELFFCELITPTLPHLSRLPLGVVTVSHGGVPLWAWHPVSPLLLIHRDGMGVGWHQSTPFVGGLPG